MNKKILIIDDDPITLKLLSFPLRTVGFEVITLTDSTLGVETIIKEHPDVIILDVMMPGKDGYTLFKEIKSNYKITDTPVIIISARQEMESAFLEVGVDCFISKPCDIEFLINKINNLLGSYDPSFEAKDLTKKVQEEDELYSIKKLLMSGGVSRGDLSDSLTSGKKNKKNEGIEFGKKALINPQRYEKLSNFKKPANWQRQPGPQRVLIAGQISFIMNFLKEEFLNREYEVKMVDNGEEILVLNETFKPDLILLETQMDTTTALEILESLRNNELYDTYILLYTYHIDEHRASKEITNILYALRSQMSKEELSQPIHSLGFFKKRTFLKKIEPFMNRR